MDASAESESERIVDAAIVYTDYMLEARLVSVEVALQGLRAIRSDLQSRQVRQELLNALTISMDSIDNRYSKSGGASASSR